MATMLDEVIGAVARRLPDLRLEEYETDLVLCADFWSEDRPWRAAHLEFRLGNDHVDFVAERGASDHGECESFRRPGAAAKRVIGFLAEEDPGS